MNKIVIFILFFLASFQGVTQTFADKEYYLIDSLDLEKISELDKQLVDSCLKIYHTAKNDTSRINAISTIVEACWDDNVWPKYNKWVYNFVEKKLKTQHSLLVTKFFKKSLAGALNNFGYFCSNYEGDVIKAIEYYQKSLEIKKEVGDKEGVATALNNIGYIYKNQGDIPKAIEYYHESFKIYEELGNKKGISASLNNIANIYNHQGNTPKALEYYHRALEINKEMKDDNNVSFSLNNIGTIYGMQGEDSIALGYFQESLNIQEGVSNTSGIAHVLSSIGGIYDKQGNYSKALEYFERALKLREETGDKIGVSASLSNIGYALLGEGNLQEAHEYGNRSFVIAQELGFPDDIKYAAKLLSVIYEEQNKGMQALEMHKLYILMRDSINNEATEKASVQQQAKYEYEKRKTMDDAEHDKLLAIEQEEKEKQRVISIAVGLGLVFVVLFLLFVFNRLRVTKKQKTVIEKQKEVVEVAHNQLEEKNKEITDSMNYAKRIQLAILPPAKIVKEYLKESFILYKPKDIVAGDFYWLEHQKGKVLYAAADCTGHGIPGAMVSVICNNGLNRSVREYGLTDPGEILDKTREIVIQEFEKSEEDVKDGMDIALCSLSTQMSSNGTYKLEYAGANNPLWIIRNGEVLETKANKEPIGKFDRPTPYTTHTFEVLKGDAIYIFSDGYADQFGGERGKKFKAKSFKELLLKIQAKSMEEQCVLIDDVFEKWRGNLEQIDDVCVIGVKICDALS